MPRHARSLGAEKRYMPASVLNAVRTLYEGAQTRVKVNGELGEAFDNTSGVKQGCPLSPLLYVLVQEVQLRMIRDAPDIQGIPIPDADGRPPTALRLPPEVRERGLVDDTAVALASRESIPPLLRVLDRFEAMSNHRMNISKTTLLVLGKERTFDIAGGGLAAQLLRHRGLTRAYDITPGKDDALPEKWHGITLGNEAGVARVWKDTVAEAGATATATPATSAGRARHRQSTTPPESPPRCFK